MLVRLKEIYAILFPLLGNRIRIDTLLVVFPDLEPQLAKLNPSGTFIGFLVTLLNI